METKTVTHEVFLNATPHEVFETYLDDKLHSEFSGAPAKIDRKLGGQFTAYGEHPSGTTLEIEKDKKIVQEWRSNNWPAGHHSRLVLTLSPGHGGKGTQLSMVQTGVPAKDYDDINNGWRTYYWTKLEEYFRAKEASRRGASAS